MTLGQQEEPHICRARRDGRCSARVASDDFVILDDASTFLQYGNPIRCKAQRATRNRWVSESKRWNYPNDHVTKKPPASNGASPTARSQPSSTPLRNRARSTPANVAIAH